MGKMRRTYGVPNGEMLHQAIAGAVDDVDRRAGAPLGEPDGPYRKSCSARIGRLVIIDPAENMDVLLQRIVPGDEGGVVGLVYASDKVKTATLRAAPGQTINGYEAIKLEPRDAMALIALRDGTWAVIKSADVEPVIRPTPPDYRGLYAAGVTGGGFGVLLKFDMNDKEWTEVADVSGQPVEFMSVYARSHSDIWVCGENVLFHFDGDSWANEMSGVIGVLENYNGGEELWAVAGDDEGDDIFIGGSYDWAAGETSGTSGFIVKFDGTSYSLDYTTADIIPVKAIDVVSGGNAFARTDDRFYVRTSGGWALDTYAVSNTNGDSRNSVRAFSDTSVVTIGNAGSDGYRCEWDGTTRTDTIVTDGGGDSIDGASVNDFWLCKFPIAVDKVTWFVDKAIEQSWRSTANSGTAPWGAVALKDVCAPYGESYGVWVCGTYDAGWGGPVLSYWDGEAWSDESEYGVGLLGNINLNAIARVPA